MTNRSSSTYAPMEWSCVFFFSRINCLYNQRPDMIVRKGYIYIHIHITDVYFWVKSSNAFRRIAFQPPLSMAMTSSCLLHNVIFFLFFRSFNLTTLPCPYFSVCVGISLTKSRKTNLIH
ncbi:Uncharacterized protein APZ42_024599 [Daphnia magna]|uniref:Uncharacterized protein n=1 Tax=Daphnia magna TaxID=35525 RepID=A0A0P6BWW3_9CRUS|nr:Uncharacterized protein APZ42_024599 [Daphnia magna]